MKIVVGEFDTRREADRAMERLVQEYGIERTGIAFAPEGRGEKARVAEGGSALMPAISIEADDETAELVRNVLVTAGAAHAHVC